MKCDERSLRAALDDDSNLSAELAIHIAECASCRQRLDELVADSTTWDIWREVLADSQHERLQPPIVTFDSTLASDLPVQMDTVPLDFLEAPAHPEMLGRIGRYEIERVVGMGGMGVVLKAYDTELHRIVAIKVLLPQWSSHGGARQRFAREAQSAALVVHENVIPIFDINVSGKNPFLVMQYVDGQSLHSRVESDGPLDVEQVLLIGVQIAKGLAAAHGQGLVHRDVKPGNVLLETNVDRVLLSDFGLARAADDASLSRSGLIAGTPHYMSPEQALGQALDAASDLFSLGGVLYFMLAGHPPFRAPTALAVLNRICHQSHRAVDENRHDVPGMLAKLIDQLLQKDRRRRPASATVVAEKLTEMLSQYRGKPNRLPSRRTQRLWKIVTWCGVGAIGAAGLGGSYFWMPPASLISGTGLRHGPWEGVPAQATDAIPNPSALSHVDRLDEGEIENTMSAVQTRPSTAMDQADMTTALQVSDFSDNQLIWDMSLASAMAIQLESSWKVDAPVSNNEEPLRWQTAIQEVMAGIQVMKDGRQSRRVTSRLLKK